MDTIFSKLKEDEININFLYVLKECIKYTRYIIVVAAVFAILLPMIKYKVDYDKYKTDTQMSEQNTIENLEKNLSLLERNTLSEYENLITKIEYFEQYQLDSTLINIDVENVYGADVQFWIDASEDTKEQLTTFYVNYTRNMRLAEKIASLRANQAGDIQELVWINSAENGIIELHIINESKEGLEELVTQVEAAYRECSNALSEVTSEHSIKCIQKEYFYGYEEAVFTKQKSFYEVYASLLAQKNQMEQSFSENQKLIVFKNENGNATVKLREPSVEIVYGILGFILGAMFGLLCVAAKAIFDGRIHSETEINKRFGYRHLEHICLSSKKGLIHFGNKNRKEIEDILELISRKIFSQMSNEEFKRIAILVNRTSVENIYIEKLVEALDEYGVKVDILYDIVHNTKDYIKLEEHKYVVYVCEIGVQKIKTLYQENAICADAGVEILGYVSVSQ